MTRTPDRAISDRERREDEGPVIEFLSPREHEDLRLAEAKEAGWARVIRLFLDGPRLLLGWDLARSDEEIARLVGLDETAARRAIEDAVRWSVEHRLHLLGWQEPDGGWRYFMAVG
jgi:hypothetical protein